MISPINSKIYYYNDVPSFQNRKSIAFTGSSIAKTTDTTTFAYRQAELIRQNKLIKRQALLNPITSEKEYLKVLNRVLRYPIFKYCLDDIIYAYPKTNLFGERIPYIITDYIKLKGYEYVKNNLKGLVAYCGSSDISRQINRWLTARKDNNPTLLTDKQMADVVRTFDYSLRELDKIYGKINGTVYRAGMFNPNEDKQYYSASDTLYCAMEHSYKEKPSENMPYNIIRLKEGHNIYKFQKDTNSDVSSIFANYEREILIDRHSKFRLVPKEEYTNSELEDIESIIQLSLDCDQKDLSPDKKQQMLEHIFVWEEI